ncbi:MAG: hypothetical protein IH987_17750, partial [Planctomycetes bacterium]|nr:hypothetical protein [Planctomycetota bacterium]
EKLITSITGEAVKDIFKNYCELSDLEGVVEAFADRHTSIEIGDETPTADLVAKVEKLPALKKAAEKLGLEAGQSIEEPAQLAAAAEFILDALYVNNRLSKYAYHGKTLFKR